MSTIKSSNLPRVIVRSFGDEPVALTAFRLDQRKRRVFVGKNATRRPISLPTTDVFDYDETWFGKLQNAHSEGNPERLKEIYAEIKRKNALQ